MVLPCACRVCGKTIHNYRGLASHLRHNLDVAHDSLRSEWRAYRDSYHKTLTCRKCGAEFEVTSKSNSNRKRCSKCTRLRGNLGKKLYEKTQVSQVKRVTKHDSFHWVRGDSNYTKVVQAIDSGVSVNRILREFGITYRTFLVMAHDFLGEQEYLGRVQAKRLFSVKKAYTVAHEKYLALTPEERAQRIRDRCGKSSKLEVTLVNQLVHNGYTNFVRNDWQSVPIKNTFVPREADLKISLEDGRKVVVMCDGEAFHGPRAIFGDPKDRIASDIETARGYHSLGYSVLRYSESEINSGVAIGHLVRMLNLLRSYKQVLRSWFPPMEQLTE